MSALASPTPSDLTPTPAAASGRLIVLEGGDGVGKSTQIAHVASALRQAGHSVLCLREPGGTALGTEIRNLLLDSANEITPVAEALMFMVSRAQLVATVIRPALAAGQTVLLDRFFLSTYAYQVFGRGLPLEEMRQANQWAAAGLVPDLTLLLTLPVEESSARARSRGALDRMELAGDSFAGRVLDAYLRFARPEEQARLPECGVIVPVDATGSEAEVTARLLACLTTAGIAVSA